MISSDRPHPTGLQGTLEGILQAPYKSFSRGKKAEESAPIETRVSTCRMCGNKAWCSVIVTIRNGVVIGIEGDPSNPVSQGKLCARGQAAIYNLYNPYRVTAPMKRTNPRKGLDEDPGWVEISWEEALETVAARLRKIRAEDPRKFAHIWGFGGDWWIVQHEAFLPAFGTPNLLRSHGVLCPVHYGCSLTQGSMLDRQDGELCEYLITIGGSLGPNLGSAHSIRALARARERGIKVVVVDPRCSQEATHAAEWIPIRPGTDLAFALSLLHTELYEIQTFDEKFLKQRTNAVYLVGEDGHYARDAASGKPLVWDPVDSRAKTFDDGSIKDYALEGNHYVVDDKKVATAFTLVKKAMRSYTPEWGEHMTTVPAATTRRIAREFVEAAHIGETITLDGVEFPFRPALVKGERGSYSRRGGAYQHLVHKMLNMLVGSLDVPGGDLAADVGPALSPDPDGVVAPKREAIPVPWKYPPDVDLAQFYPHRHTTPYLAWRTVLNPAKYGLDYELDTLMIYGANPISNAADPREAVAALSKIPFVVSIAYVHDEVSELCDILLPEPPLLQRYGIQGINTGHFVQIQDKYSLQAHGVMARLPIMPVDPKTRQADDIYMELAERVGFLYGEGGLNDRVNQLWEVKGEHKLDLSTRYTTEQVLDHVLKGGFGVEQGIEYFKESGLYNKPFSRAEAYNYYYYPYGTTRHPFYFERLMKDGEELRKHLEEQNISIPGQDMTDIWRFYQPIPQWVGRPDDGAPADFDLVAMNWSTPQFRMHNSDQTGNPILNDMVDATDPYLFVILMNCDTARLMGLQDGDEVIVEASWGGKTQGKLKLTELIHPEAVGIPGVTGLKTIRGNPLRNRGPKFNELLNTAEGSFDPLHGGIDRNPRVKVYRAGEVRQ